MSAILMDLALFTARYRDLHERIVPDALAGRSDDELRRRTENGSNPPAWILWHITRGEDAAVNRLATDGRQVLEDGWQLGIEERSVGTGMSAAAVERLAARIDLEGLRRYAAAVQQRTIAVAGSLAAAPLDDVVPDPYVKRVMIDEGMLLPAAHGTLHSYSNRTRRWFLTQLALIHSEGHAAQLTPTNRA
jgi:hypothetical protein